MPGRPVNQLSSSSPVINARLAGNVTASTTSSPTATPIVGGRSLNVYQSSGDRSCTVTPGSTSSSNEALNESTHPPPVSPGFGLRSLGMCSECGLRITSIADACHAMGYMYHNACFVCCCCQRTLRGKTFYKDQDKVFCEEDYLYSGFQRNAEKCAVCGHIIAEKILQAMGKSYHPGCFRCYICNECLDGIPFTVDANNMVYCIPDYHLVYAPTCGVCAAPIMPEKDSDEVIRVVALNREFHLKCFCCENCGMLLANEADKRCYPLREPDPLGNGNYLQHLLCLSCHLTKIGAIPATTSGPTSGGNGSANGRSSSGIYSHHSGNLSTRLAASGNGHFPITSTVSNNSTSIGHKVSLVYQPHAITPTGRTGSPTNVLTGTATRYRSPLSNSVSAPFGLNGRLSNSSSTPSWMKKT